MALADPEIEVIGITCVSGNVALNKVLRNVMIVLDATGTSAAPIFAGASRPLIGPHVHAGEVAFPDIPRF